MTSVQKHPIKYIRTARFAKMQSHLIMIITDFLAKHEKRFFAQPLHFTSENAQLVHPAGAYYKRRKNCIKRCHACIGTKGDC